MFGRFSPQLATIRSESRLRHLLLRLPSYCPETLVSHLHNSSSESLFTIKRYPVNTGSLKSGSCCFLFLTSVLRFYLLVRKDTKAEVGQLPSTLERLPSALLPLIPICSYIKSLISCSGSHLDMCPALISPMEANRLWKRREAENLKALSA